MMPTVGVNGRATGLVPAVEIGDRHIPYLLDSGAGVLTAAQALDADRWLVVADDDARLAPFTARVVQLLTHLAPVERITVPAGDAAKSLETVGSVCAQALALGASRASCLVAVGGGSTCNIVGLCAALLFRGIRLVQVPTTLMAMSDVVLSLKQGVNFCGVKNGLGTYHAAEFVWADPEVLATLPHTEIRAGQAEMIKNALVLAPEQIPVLLELFRAGGGYRTDEFHSMITMAISAKSRVLRRDATERRAALVLEYGHTVGHALEVLTGGRLGHGFGVAFGMRVAARVAAQQGLADAALVDLHDELIRSAGLPLLPPAEVLRAANRETLAAALRRDNKRGYLRLDDRQVSMVLLSSPGAAVVTGSLPLTPVGIPAVVNAFAETFAQTAGTPC